MLNCPHCKSEIDIRQLPHQGLFANFRICPNCKGAFTPDPDTKIRHALVIVMLLISLALTLLLYYESDAWLVPSVASYIALGWLVYWGNKKMYLVPYAKSGESSNGT